MHIWNNFPHLWLEGWRGWKQKSSQSRKHYLFISNAFSAQLHCTFIPAPPSQGSSFGRYFTRLWFPWARQKLCTKTLLHVVLSKHRLLLSKFSFLYSSHIHGRNKIHWDKSRKWSTGLIAEMLLLCPVTGLSWVNCWMIQDNIFFLT